MARTCPDHRELRRARSHGQECRRGMHRPVSNACRSLIGAHVAIFPYILHPVRPLIGERFQSTRVWLTLSRSENGQNEELLMEARPGIEPGSAALQAAA